MWDYWAQAPEAMHQITILFSDRGIPDGYRFMNGYGSHAFSFWNKKGERFWVKFHFKSRQGIKCLTPAQASALAGENPDYAIQDLYEAIERGEYPKWGFYVQIMPEMEAEKTTYNPFDLTKVWPHKDYPLIEVGEITLNRNPKNYFAEVEQAALSPANLIAGIGASPDKMLQARLFAYPDAQRYRIGANYQSLPVNRPKCPVMHYQRDGAMRFDGNGDYDNYEPNGFGGPTQDPSVAEPPLKISGYADRHDQHKGNDDFTQAGNLYNILTNDEKNRLAQNIAGAMKGIGQELIEANLKHFDKCSADYGQRIRQYLL